jgi:hypothetical protein
MELPRGAQAQPDWNYTEHVYNKQGNFVAATLVLELLICPVFCSKFVR